MFGLQKTALKIAVAVGISGTFIGSLWSKVPQVVFGVTISLWIIYILTITLDWVTGLNASRYEAKKKGDNFIYDKDKANTNWYKHALFIIIISSIYYLQRECIRLDMNKIFSNSLVGIQLAYFAYNMITEWVSIEKNRYRINGKYSRLGNLLKNTLDIADKAALKKVKKITDSED